MNVKGVCSWGGSTKGERVKGEGDGVNMIEVHCMHV
jgi:hypothetical protein